MKDLKGLKAELQNSINTNSALKSELEASVSRFNETIATSKRTISKHEGELESVSSLQNHYHNDLIKAVKNASKSSKTQNSNAVKLDNSVHDLVEKIMLTLRKFEANVEVHESNVQNLDKDCAEDIEFAESVAVKLKETKEKFLALVGAALAMKQSSIMLKSKTGVLSGAIVGLDDQLKTVSGDFRKMNKSISDQIETLSEVLKSQNEELHKVKDSSNEVASELKNEQEKLEMIN